MSCIDVMYQSLQRNPFFQHSCNKNSGNSSNGTGQRAIISNPLTTVKVEEDQSESGSDKDSIPEAEYVSAKCVIFTYFTGDTNKVVDDHFTKALNQPSSFTSDVVAQTRKQPVSDDRNNNKSSLMSQRAFPPSFWSSNYYNVKRSNGHSDLSSIQEAVFGDTCSGPSANRTDTWQYSLAQSAYSYRPITELGYGVSSSNSAVFNPRYSSLLIQPPVRPSRLPSFQAQCDYTKPTDPGWSIAYTNPHINADYPSYAVDNAATTSMAENQDSNKDPFWF